MRTVTDRVENATMCHMPFVTLEGISARWRRIGHGVRRYVSATRRAGMPPDQLFSTSDFPLILHQNTRAAADRLDAIVPDTSVELIELADPQVLYQSKYPCCGDLALRTRIEVSHLPLTLKTTCRSHKSALAIQSLIAEEICCFFPLSFLRESILRLAVDNARTEEACAA